MIKKILIANRGEIAVRVIRTCKEIGINTVAIFSKPDRTSLHVLLADEAYCVGEASAIDSYLNLDKIFEIIKKSNVDAVHPGYGFLSENYIFAKKIQDYGIIWIGPESDAIIKMGDKMAARKLALDSGVPVVPGTIEPIANIADAKDSAIEIGYPILIKAAGGGGGKGMRIVQSENELENSINRAQSEAKKSFADERVYLEKYLEEPHHVEIQVFADKNGNVVSLGERECSIQRRYQKIIEETPSPFINNVVREKLSNAAINITKLCNYNGAGTVEFLVDKYQNFYFLEMNTRLQVEHPITEMVNNIDLVKEQIYVAYGENLSFTQNDLVPLGHSIECRIYAEDGFNNYSPSTGIITDISFPHGLGVRLDEGIRVGQEITPYYDPLLGKLVTWGENRNVALQRMIRALEEFHIWGIETNISFVLLLLRNDFFKEGKYNTHTLDSIIDDLRNYKEGDDLDIIARIGAVYFHNKLKSVSIKNNNIKKNSPWVYWGRKEELR